jgi:hypothetical protein
MRKYEVYDKPNITKELLNTIKVGDSIKVNTWKRPMKVIAVSENFFIMWKPHDYTIPEDCEEALKELESGEMEVSQRRGWGIWHLEIKRGK